MALFQQNPVYKSLSNSLKGKYYSAMESDSWLAVNLEYYDFLFVRPRQAINNQGKTKHCKKHILHI